MKKNYPLNSKDQKSRQRGFTLIEMMVSISIFTIVATLASGTFVIMAEAQRKAQSIKLVVDNVNFALDGMVIAMRTSKNYQVGCLDGGSYKAVSFDYKDSSGTTKTTSYVIIGETLKKVDGVIDCDATNGFSVISEDEVDIDADKSGFVLSPPPPITFKPWVRLNLTGTAQSSQNNITEFNIQTFVSKRNI